MRDPVDGLRRVDPGYKVPKGQIKFSKTEILHITVAILVLSVAFSVVMRRRFTSLDPSMNDMLFLLGFSFILVVFSFLIHEFGHKFVAQRYNAWSEFRAYPFGLLFALMMSFMGFLFAAPGAVYIRGNIDKEMNGKISLAGPAVNFVVSAIAIVLFFMTGGLLATLFGMLAYLNAFLGLFNLIPIPPFDGSKIVAWDLKVYIVAALVGAVELIAVFTYVF